MNKATLSNKNNIESDLPGNILFNLLLNNIPNKERKRGIDPRCDWASISNTYNVQKLKIYTKDRKYFFSILICETRK